MPQSEASVHKALMLGKNSASTVTTDEKPKAWPIKVPSLVRSPLGMRLPTLLRRGHIRLLREGGRVSASTSSSPANP